MTNKFHNAWRGFLNEQEDKPPEELPDGELTKDELAIWQNVLADVSKSFSLKESFLAEYLIEQSPPQRILDPPFPEEEDYDPRNPPFDPRRTPPPTGMPYDPLSDPEEIHKSMQTTRAQQKKGEEKGFPKAVDKDDPQEMIPGIGSVMPIKLSSKYSKDSSFCQVFPGINKWSQESADNFGETVLFVYATMQTTWPRVAVFFRFLVDFVKENQASPSNFEQFVYRPPRNNTQTDYNEFKYYLGKDLYAKYSRRLRQAVKARDDASSREYLINKVKELRSLKGRDGRSRYETNKRIRARVDRMERVLRDSQRIPEIEYEIEEKVNEQRNQFRDQGLPDYETARDNYENALSNHNGYRGTELTALFKKIHGVSELTPEQEEYVSTARGVIAYMAATPGARYYVPTWNSRASIFSSVSEHLKKYNKDKNPNDLLDLLVDVVKIPGIGVVKGGLLVQLLTGQLGCIDNVWQKILYAQDEVIAERVKRIVRSKKPDAEKALRDYASAYITLLETLEKSYSVDSKGIFEVWSQITTLANKGGPNKGYNMNLEFLKKSTGKRSKKLSPVQIAVRGESNSDTFKFYTMGGGPNEPRTAKEQDPRTLDYPQAVKESKVLETFKKWKKSQWD